MSTQTNGTENSEQTIERTRVIITEDRYPGTREMHRHDSSRLPQPYWNPYLSGVLLALVLLTSYAVLGTGLGASSAPSPLTAQLELWIAPARVAASEYFGPWGDQPLLYYLVFMFVGTFLGGLFSAMLARRAQLQVEPGRGVSVGKPLIFALVGGVIVGYASRIARGCTSGQALGSGALLLSGSLVFLTCLFVAGYASAFLFRNQWND